MDQEVSVKRKGNAITIKISIVGYINEIREHRKVISKINQLKRADTQ
jgi:hypothetical protein